VTSVNPYRQIRTWLRERPLVSDVIFAVVILGLSVFGQASGPAPEGPVRTQSVLAYTFVVLSCVALVMRRRRPVAVWAAIVAFGVIGVWVEGNITQSVLPTMIALYTIASLRPWRTAIAAALATAAILAGSAYLVSEIPLLTDATYALLAIGGMSSAIGIAVRNQRAVVASAEERARVAELTREEEAQRRVTEERLRIARELHDVVAHHISVINVQAGVARHLLASDPEAADQALGHVRDSSQVVLTEMGTILGLLRTPDDPTATQPAPSLDQIDGLVDAVRHAGLDVTWSVTGTPTPLGPGTELAAYRLVQESLTNARRHGSGRADLTIRYEPTVVTIDVANALRADAVGGGSGHGLVGMRERVAAAGGSLDVGARDGQFQVHATLPADPAARRVTESPVGRP
jgi:signal transduction histidine kinase